MRPVKTRISRHGLVDRRAESPTRSGSRRDAPDPGVCAGKAVGSRSPHATTIHPRSRTDRDRAFGPRFWLMPDVRLDQSGHRSCSAARPRLLAIASGAATGAQVSIAKVPLLQTYGWR